MQFDAYFFSSIDFFLYLLNFNNYEYKLSYTKCDLNKVKRFLKYNI